jgi:hypothetical protein
LTHVLPVTGRGQIDFNGYVSRTRGYFMTAPDAEDGGELRLEDSGLEDVVAALLAGAPIWRGEDTHPFIFSNPDSVKVFSFYAEHRDFWRRNRPVQATEVNNLLIALESVTPELTASSQRQEGEQKRWSLRRIEAHRFGGLHRHCGANGVDPDIFTLAIDKDITLIGGFNGAGKTALLSSVIWCLTGKALRSQHMPDEVHEPMPVYWAETDDDGEEGESPERSHISVPPVVPIPSGADLEALDDEPKCDTWVRLTFHEEDSGDQCNVTRRLIPRASGRVTMEVEGLDGLGLSQLAIEVGTLMPGVAAHMRFDEKTDFAQAIAQLTGLKPLEDLGKRSNRVLRRMRGEETRAAKSARGEKRTQFDTQNRAMREAWQAQPDLGAPKDLIAPGEELEGVDCASSIVAARTHLEEAQNALVASVEQILGHRLELGDEEDVRRQSRTLDEAADELKGPALSSLPSMGAIKALGQIAEDDLAAAEAAIRDIVVRANDLVQRLEDAAQAARWQLYARVAAWHREHHPDVDLEACPVCGTDLKDVPADALVDLSVKEALEHCREADADMAKTAAEWERDTAASVLDALPETIRGFADQSLPGELQALYRQAFIDEFLAKRAFSGRLEPLRSNAANVWEIARTEFLLPDAPEKIAVELPPMVGAGTLATRLANIADAIQLARHRQASATAIENLVKRYIGFTRRGESGESEPEGEEQPDADKAPLKEQIETIRRCVQNAEPVVSLIRQLNELDRTRQAWEADNHRVGQLARAAAAMDPFITFPELVYEQVTGLITALHTRTEMWLGRLYRPHYLGGPDYSGIDPTAEQGIGLRAGVGDMQVPAHQVMNASLLRACVWAFVFSLWEHVRTRAGGLDSVLLDDPQAYFDPMNSENLAAAVTVLPDNGMHPLVTSNDARFLASLRDKLPRRTTKRPSWTALQLNPISSSRLTASVSPSVEEIRERRDRWKEDDNNAGKAQEFVERVRIHLENHLWNLLATDPLVMHDPTLADLLN